VVIDHEGLVDKFVGDEVVAFFATPFAGPEHAKAAVAAAQALLQQTGHGDPKGPWLPIGAGVHTGVAFVGAIGDAGVSDFTALGDAVNSTARLASAAGPGEILVSRAAATAAGMSGDGLEQRHLELRGRTEPIDVFVLRHAAPVNARH
jgi:adenylate cyclase